MNRIGILLREPWIEKFSCLEEMIKKLLIIGFSHIELPQKHFFPEKEIGFLRRIKKEKNISYSVHASCPCGLINLTNPNYLNFEFRAEQLFEFSRKIEATLINFDFDLCYKTELCWAKTPNSAWQRMYQTLTSRINFLLNQSQETKIEIAFENADVREPEFLDIVRFGMKPGDFLTLKKDCPEIKITLDIGHLFLEANWFHFDMFKDFLEPLFPLIIHTHLSSNFGKDNGFGFKDYQKGIGDLHLSLQKGILPWRKIVRFLLNHGYQGSFLLEIGPEIYQKNLTGILEEIKISYDLLNSFLRDCLGNS